MFTVIEGNVALANKFPQTLEHGFQYNSRSSCKINKEIQQARAEVVRYYSNLLHQFH